jgi:NAD-dependent dihydropyrimidine dehydrogenase PreA subunit
MEMDQASNKMHFMPGESQRYTYVAEQGHEMPHDVVYSGSVIPLSTALDTDRLNSCGVDTCDICESTCPVGCHISETSEPDCTIFVKITAFIGNCQNNLH